MQITILRLSHRLPRDERISTHVALVARAFGANSIIYSGQHDSGLEESVGRICEQWGGAAGGGPFTITYEKSYQSIIKRFKKQGCLILHLTMYGIPLPKILPEIKTKTQNKKPNKILIIVGSEAVPRQVYELSDFNISVTSQPHSEVAALAITLDRLKGGKELEGFDHEGKLYILPAEREKIVRKAKARNDQK